VVIEASARYTPPMKSDRYKDSGIVLLLAFGMVLLTPLKSLWVTPQGAWWSPFVMWGVLVAAGAWLAREGRRG